MRRGATRERVLDVVRHSIESIGASPTCREIGARVGISGPAAWKHVQKLVGERKLVRIANGGIDLPDRFDLSGIPTERLRGELARRGVTLAALDTPGGRINEGRACAANHCFNRVKIGQLMCRQHWFRLPLKYRSDIMSAWSARHTQAYQDAVEAARDFLGGYSRVAERVE